MTWQTVTYGYWNSPAIWIGGFPPSYTASDTLLIYHPVVIEENLILNSGAYLFIDSAGGICGHKKMTVSTGAKVRKFGILELDTLAVPGGDVFCLPPGQFILTEYAIISNGGYVYITSGLNVWDWIDCRTPEYFFAPVGELPDELSKTVIFYDVVAHELNIKNNNSDKIIVISDALGRRIVKMELSDGDNRIKLPGYLRGVYFFRISDWKNLETGNGKLIILH